MVEAYGAGEIELEAVDPKTNKSAIFDDLTGGKSYTLSTGARFLGWVNPSDGQATNDCREAFYLFGSSPAALRCASPGLADDTLRSRPGR